ncbi:MAG: hypothetical protein JW891_12575 [Candidatus Lokiarchaeota archaeon]|nr:hypothetical protein [Candidatus Lokiarchaeota archaeon]
MTGRTKQTAEAIASKLSVFDVSFLPIELNGNSSEKKKYLASMRKNDFSLFETILNNIDFSSFDILLFGMPTHGRFPPKIFEEIVSKGKNLSGKEAVVFTTARITGKKALYHMKDKVEEKGARVINQNVFRKLFKLGTEDAIKFGIQLNTRYK